jgi:thiamine-monophosphate kinase
MNEPRPPTPPITSLGELGLIERIARIVGSTSVVVGIGDDAAVIDRPGDAYLLATVDMLVENVHFRTVSMGAGELGQRAIEINASDIAAMGGAPDYALISLALPPHLEVAFVDELFEGLLTSSSRHGVQIVGGNLTRTAGPITVDVTLLGSITKSDLVTRRGACIGDVLAVTGTLGEAAAARILGGLDSQSDESELADRLTRPVVPHARVAEGQALARAHLAHAMIDISDGLSTDLWHLCEASEVGVVVEEAALPMTSRTRWAASQLSRSAVELALSGGEDYELLVAIAGADLPKARQLGIDLTPIGRVVPHSNGLSMRSADGSERELRALGWSHF